MNIQEILNLVIQFILAGGGLWVLKIVIDRYFRMQDIKAQEFKHLSDQLADMLTEIRLIIQRLDTHNEIDEEYRVQVEERFLQINTLIAKEVNSLKEEDAGIEIVNKERYNELKGKIKSVWADLTPLKEKLNILATEHEIHHNKKSA